MGDIAWAILVGWAIWWASQPDIECDGHGCSGRW